MIESSSGNLGHALSLVCAIKGYEFICVTDPNANRSAIKSIELYGGKVIVVEERDRLGFLGTRLDQIDELLKVESKRCLVESVRQHREQERARRTNRGRDRKRV